LKGPQIAQLVVYRLVHPDRAPIDEPDHPQSAVFTDLAGRDAFPQLAKLLGLDAQVELSGRSVADVVADAAKRLPVGRRRASGSPRNGNTKTTTAKKGSLATAAKAAIVVNNGKTDLPTINGVNGGSING